VLFAMWYGGSSQNNAAAYLLFFVFGSVFLVSIPHTLLNVAGLDASAESAKPAFAGDEVSFPIEIVNASRKSRHGICVTAPNAGGEEERVDEIAAGKAARVILRFPAKSRGEHLIGDLCLTSGYPLGFLRAVKHVDSSQRYLVYPRPAGTRTLPVQQARSRENRPQADWDEGDDFAGVRAYVPGESQRHIDWKAVARGQPLMTKRYTAEMSGVLYLDFAGVPLNDIEARLAQLALWIIEAERARHSYGLRLPGIEIAPSMGEAHFHRCLRALALFK
jgi:uncharacterized protein (DUF58 family)